MASYAYYVLNDPLMTDGEFDELAREILSDYEKWSTHPHCPTPDDLRAGTYLGEYPTQVRIATEIYKDYRNAK